ncbi:hypothetical protein [Endozoicomonas sp. 4G]|uniref:hypothetical protein n=1 Tax=Endozoicomonas sp. 4G TaxID=2872754 RepID=UPI002078E1E2|nr:hypothetical protein [Endozoicomonas sp. 4G]
MKKSFNLFPLLLCLFYSTAQASPPSQNDFDFIKPFNHTALVANEFELTESIAGLSVSTLLNLGIWWGICKTAGVASGLSRTHDLAASDTKELEKLKTDFCLQMAPVMTTAEVALAGHVSPWPLERWWKAMYFAGAGMVACAAVAQIRGFVPVVVLNYLVSEAVTRTISSTTWVSILRTMSARDITIEWYVAGKYTRLSALNMVTAGGVAYAAMTHEGFGLTKGILAAVVIAAGVGTLSGIIPESMIAVDGQTKTGVAARAAARADEAMYTVTTTVLVIAGALAVNLIKAETGAPSLFEPVAIAGAFVGYQAGIGAAAEALAETKVKVEPEIGVMVGVQAITLGGFGLSLMLVSSEKTSSNPFIQAGVTLAPALALAVINSLSNHIVYGYPLEQSLSETSWTQWKKFYAPLDYLSTLFK